MTAERLIAYDPYDHTIQDDPFPVYAELREHAPLYRNEEHGFWALSRHADVLAALRDETTYSSKMGVSIDPASWGPQARYAMSFIAMDPPDQTRLRALVSRGFTPRRVQEMESSIRKLACEYLDDLAAAGQARLHRRVRRQVPDGRHLRAARGAEVGPGRAAPARRPAHRTPGRHA